MRRKRNVYKLLTSSIPPSDRSGSVPPLCQLNPHSVGQAPFCTGHWELIINNKTDIKIHENLQYLTCI